MRTEKWSLSPILPLAFLGYLMVLTVWLLRQPIPSLQDYQEWVYQGWIGAHLLHGDQLVSSMFRFAPYPVPNEFSQIVLALLTLCVGFSLGSKLFLTLLLAISGYLCWLAGKKVPVRQAHLAPSS
jgi:hypothetical protein